MRLIFRWISKVCYGIEIHGEQYRLVLWEISFVFTKTAAFFLSLCLSLSLCVCDIHPTQMNGRPLLMYWFVHKLWMSNSKLALINLPLNE